MELKTITIASLLQIYEGDFTTDWVVKDFVNILILNELNKYNFVFKGGTALYKQLEGDMHRFSEDIDLYMDKEEYEKNKKAIRETINSLQDYEIIQKIEFDESQSGSNTRVYNIYYSDDNASDMGIDSGRCQIEIALVGGTPTQKSECNIHSIIKFENIPILTTKFNCVNISEILVVL